MTAFGGNMGILLRAYIYARMLGAEGMRRVSEYATLNANYLGAPAEAGFSWPIRSAAPATSSSSR
jgi:glycine dehydrogenase subunit 2